MIMDKEQLEKIANERYPSTYFDGAVQRDDNVAHIKRAAFISGYNYHKQESEGLREEVLTNEKNRLETQSANLYKLIQATHSPDELKRLTGKLSGLNIALENIRQSLTPPHLTKENDEAR